MAMHLTKTLVLRVWNHGQNEDFLSYSKENWIHAWKIQDKQVKLSLNSIMMIVI